MFHSHNRPDIDSALRTASGSFDGLYERANVAIAVGERLKARGIVRRLWDMVRHQQVRIAHFLVDLNRLDKIDVALVRIDLHKIVTMSADVSEVNIENLLPRAEVADHIIDLLAGIGQHFRDATLAEVQAIVRTR